MLFVHSDNLEEQRQLETEFSVKNGYYMIPNRQAHFVSEMLTAI